MCYNGVMKNFWKSLIVCLIMLGAQGVFAAEKILVIPDNIESHNVNYYVYPDTAEFFASEVINLINTTKSLTAPSVSNIKTSIDKDPKLKLLMRDALNRYKTRYTVDYNTFKKIANKYEASKVLLVTSGIDVQNYVLRRTLWDFLNIPGATVIDAAYKVSTYTALIDVNKEITIWSDTYDKTLSTVENRIVANSFAPAYEQLEKLKDYSKLLSYEIVQNVQLNTIPQAQLETNAELVYYDSSMVNTKWTKRYRKIKKETGKIYRTNKAEFDENYNEVKNNVKDKYYELKQNLNKNTDKSEVKPPAQVVNIKQSTVYKYDTKQPDLTKDLINKIESAKSQPVQVDENFTPSRPRVREQKDFTINNL